jgi:hypothetical protein
LRLRPKVDFDPETVRAFGVILKYAAAAMITP